MADPDNPEELSADEVLVELRAAGIATLPSLQAMIANAGAHQGEAERRRPQFPLIALTPMRLDDETARRAAERGELIAEQKGGKHGRWFATVTDMENWMASGVGSRARTRKRNGARPCGVGLARFEAWDKQTIEGAWWPRGPTEREPTHAEIF
jgi:hypothetical protein